MYKGKKFAAVFNCMDGRVQVPVIEFVKYTYDVDYVDMITEAGINKVLAEYKQENMIESIKSRADISVNKHYSKLIAIVGHYDCGGNTANEQEQKEHIKTAIENIKTWNYDVEIIGLWVDKNWEVHQV